MGGREEEIGSRTEVERKGRLDCGLAYCYERREGCILDFTGLVSGEQHNTNLLEKKEEERKKTTHSLNNVSIKIDSISKLAEISCTEGPEYLAGRLLQGQKPTRR